MKKILLPLIIIIATNVYSQQLPMYSQYMFNMVNINPAYTGARNTGTATMLYRNQWNSFPGSPVTGVLSYDERLKNENHALGVQTYFDRVGIENRTGIQGSYSFKAAFNKSALHIGISAGVLNYSANFRRSNPFNLGDPGLTSSVSTFLPTFGAGLLYETKNWFAAISLPAFFKTRVNNITDPIIEKAGREAHYFITTGFTKKLSEEVILKPSVMIKAVSGAPVQYDLNMNVCLGEKFTVGASYRTGDAILALAEYQVSSRMRFGYAYDYIISDLGNYSRNNHEFMIRYDVKKAK